MIPFAGIVETSLRGRGARFRGRALLSANHSEDLILADDHVLHVVDLDLSAGVLAYENAVADLDVKGDPFAVVAEAAGADRHDLALERLLLGGVRDDDAALRLLLGIHPLDQHPVVERFHLHAEPPCKDWSSFPDPFMSFSGLGTLLALASIEC